MSQAFFAVIHAGEQISMRGSLACKELIVHLGTPRTRIDLAGHSLTWRALEIIGRGSAEIVDGTRLVYSWRMPTKLGIARGAA